MQLLQMFKNKKNNVIHYFFSVILKQNVINTFVNLF